MTVTVPYLFVHSVQEIYAFAVPPGQTFVGTVRAVGAPLNAVYTIVEGPASFALDEQDGTLAFQGIARQHATNYTLKVRERGEKVF